MPGSAASMAAQPSGAPADDRPGKVAGRCAGPRAVLFDALGTLLGFEPPAPHLRAALRARGYETSAAAPSAAIRAEIAYYRPHLHEGGDPAALAALRARSAAAMRPALPGVPDDVLLATLLEALRFFAYPDAPPALRALREAGVRVVVVSNWDHSLHERLAETGLAPLVDGAVASAEGGAAKPQRAIFAAALALAGAEPHEAWHVGDTLEADVEGARAAGLRPVLIARDGGPAEVPGGVTAIGSLAELIPLALPR